MMIQDDDRVIHTHMYTKKAKEVLDSVFGQLSDGWGENNPRNDRWWMFGKATQEVDGEVTIHISSKTGERYCSKWVDNGFTGMPDVEVKKWMARMVKKTMMMELRDDHAANGWQRDNVDFKTCYLNYHEEISVAEVYCIYELLLDRPVGVTKYDVSVIASVQGSKSAPEEIALETEKRAKVKAVEDDFASKVKALNEEEKKLVEELKAKITEIGKTFIDKRSEAHREMVEKLKALA